MARKKKAPQGRKARSTEAATITLGIRITDDERTMIRAAARADGIDVATFVRRAISDYIRQPLRGYPRATGPEHACTEKTCNEKS